MVHSTAVPKDSEISKHLAGAHLFDAFAVSTNERERSALEIYIAVMAKTPAWVDAMMAARNKAVSLFGLKDLGHLGNVDPARKAECYRVRDRVGIFSIFYLSPQEVILIESDRHLDAKVSLYRTTGDHGNSAVMTTVIHVHNLLGRAYILFVWPLHKLIVPSLLARYACARRHSPIDVS